MTVEPTTPADRSHGARRSALLVAALATGVAASAVSMAVIGGHGILAAVQSCLALGWSLLALLVGRAGVRRPAAWSWGMLPVTVMAAMTAITMVGAIGAMTETDLWNSISLETIPRLLVSIGFWTVWAVPPAIGVGLARRARRDGAPSTVPPLAANGVILVMILLLAVFDVLEA